MTSNQNTNNKENNRVSDEHNRFLEEEKQNEYIGNAINEPTPIYSSEDSTFQKDEEYRRDKSGATNTDQSIDVSKDDLRETDADRMAGSDRAGTSERKDN